MKHDYIAVRQRIEHQAMTEGPKYAVLPRLFEDVEELAGNPELVNVSIVQEVDGHLYAYGVFRVPEVRRAGSKEAAPVAPPK